MSQRTLTSGCRSPHWLRAQLRRPTTLCHPVERAAAEPQLSRCAHGGLLHPAAGRTWRQLGIGLGDAAGAHAHAQRALQLDRSYADAWVNFGVACWQTQQRRDAAQAMHHALGLAPGLEAAALNYGLMLRAVDQLAQARDMLARAALANPRAWRLQLALAETARLQTDAEGTRRHALAALALLRPGLQLGPDAGDPPATTAPAATGNKDVLGALLAVHAALPRADRTPPDCRTLLRSGAWSTVPAERRSTLAAVDTIERAGAMLSDLQPDGMPALGMRRSRAGMATSRMPAGSGSNYVRATRDVASKPTNSAGRSLGQRRCDYLCRRCAGGRPGGTIAPERSRTRCTGRIGTACHHPRLRLATSPPGFQSMRPRSRCRARSTSSCEAAASFSQRQGRRNLALCVQIRDPENWPRLRR